jgi:hypothetical protein
MDDAQLVYVAHLVYDADAHQLSNSKTHTHTHLKMCFSMTSLNWFDLNFQSAFFALLTCQFKNTCFVSG